jgi:NAD(P)-dependent dehydrogenase (short-subunit alcohol dehydrogenase family)
MMFHGKLTTHAGGMIGLAGIRRVMLPRTPSAACQRAARHGLAPCDRDEEAAAAVSYLLSAEASFINGAIVPVDGGWSALGPDPEQA